MNRKYYESLPVVKIVNSQLEVGCKYWTCDPKSSIITPTLFCYIGNNSFVELSPGSSTWGKQEQDIITFANVEFHTWWKVIEDVVSEEDKIDEHCLEVLSYLIPDLEEMTVRQFNDAMDALRGLANRNTKK